MTEVLCIKSADYRNLVKVTTPILMKCRTQEERAVRFIEQLSQLIADKFIWVDRDKAEDDEAYLQIIPYVMVTHNNNILGYTRLAGDKRLVGMISFGAGGHVDREKDQPDGLIDDAWEAIASCVERELHEELVIPQDLDLEVRGPLEVIYQTTSPVDRVHIGLVYHLDYPLPTLDIKETDKMIGRWYDKYETMSIDPRWIEGWSRAVIEKFNQLKAVAE